jgi:hypothetical protein
MSAIEITDAVSQTQEVTMELDIVLAALKQLGCADLFKVMRTATTEAEKRAKTETKKPKKEKGETPSQLKKPTAWVRYVLKWATENGWEEFICQNKKSGEEIVMPASVEVDGEHVFPNGKKLILTQAMSLSKLLWAPKTKTGLNEELYRAFEEEFAATASEEPAEEPVEAPKTPLVRKTAAEKEAELAEKKAKVAKEAAEKKAKKAAEPKAAVPKAAIAKAEKAVAAPKATVKAVAAPKAAAKAAEAASAPAAVGQKPGPKKKAVVEWTCEDDGNVYPWTYKAKNYLRNFQNQVWEAEADGSCGDWAGEFIPAEDRIDESAADPFADEE